MRPRRSPPPPLWFVALVAGACVVCTWTTGGYDAPAPPVSQAWFGFLLLIAGWIWNGVQAAGHVTLAILAASVNFLWGFARSVYGGLIDLGRSVLQGFRLTIFRLMQLYDNVLRPAWQKFWKFIDWTRDSLERIFRPVFRALYRIRFELLKFYDRWVRPVLDALDVARKVLRVFSALGLEWAKKLDAQLAGLEAKIDAPFRFLLRELNKAINLIDRVVTADGLFQRLALIRSLHRDIAYVAAEFWGAQVKGLSEEDAAELAKRKHARDDPIETGRQLSEFYRTGGGELAGIIGELVPTWRQSAGLSNAPK